LDPALGDFARAVASARTELADAARGLGRYADSIEASPTRLAEVEERLFRIEKLLRKHGPTTFEVAEVRAQIARELERLQGGCDRIAELDAARDSLHRRVATSARALSKKRRDAAERLAAAIGKELALLGMGRARVIVDVAQPPVAAEDALSVDGA